jgi:primosomal protein N' (replication factor Y) (superfamily II helicase)
VVNLHFLCSVTFADIILPLSLPNRTYTYSVPDDLVDQITQGVRVEVPFGTSKLYSGLVERVHSDAPAYRIKPIQAVLDEVEIVSPEQLQLWDWIADYYCCTLGEVMAAALPGHLKLMSETRLIRNEHYDEDLRELSPDEYLVAEAVQLQPEITIDDVRKILGKKTVFPVIQRLMKRGVLFLREDMQEKYKPRQIIAVRLTESYRADETLLRDAFGQLDKFERQLELLMAFLQLSRSRPYVSKRELMRTAKSSDSPLQTLIKKGILETYERNQSRIGEYAEALDAYPKLSAMQQSALQEVIKHFNAQKEVVLLHGVTGSGKTQLYIELIRETILSGGQVLYLLPEIALTTQIVQRLQRVFGGDVATYHSKVNYNERVEVWQAAATGKPVILAARSGLFLPFQRLQLIIVDEEHDPSFKQYDPAPRYHARDTAIVLAKRYGAKTLLGTATPSLESWHNARSGKYGYVEMSDRFGGLQLPAIEPVDLREQTQRKQLHGIFSKPLLDALQTALDQGEQAILFQNRRGHSPVLECQTCQWTQMCQHCDVSLTYHKQQHRLRCHYCNFTAQVPSVCPACGSGKLVMHGFGTEKIEDELKIFLPDARIARMDLDTAGTKSNLTALLNDFEERELDILVGTQMVTKGLDFDNVALVGVLNADSLVRFPDFRSGERAFQLMTQVAGRAGRKNKQGKVIIQAWMPKHPVVQDVINTDFQSFMQRELAERQEFRYPPFMRLIQISLQHKDEKVVAAAAAFFTAALRDRMGPERVLGPTLPHVPRVRSYYGQQTLLKLEKDPALIRKAKQLIRQVIETTVGKKGWSQVRIAVDVDPM